MESREIKKIIERKGLVLGCFQQILTPQLTEIMGWVGFDFLVIDAEHTSINLETIENLVRASSAAHMAPIIRINENNPSIISKVLDAGAQGVLLPQLRSKEDVLQFMEAVKYPPEGNRSFCRSVRAIKYTTELEERPDCFKRMNEEVIAALIVESVEAVTNIRQITSVKDLDFILLGPGDLSAAMGLTGQLDHPQVIEKLREVIKVAEEKGIATAAYVTSLDKAKEWIRLGVTIIIFSDVWVFVQSCKDQIKELRSIT